MSDELNRPGNSIYFYGAMSTYLRFPERVHKMVPEQLPHHVSHHCKLISLRDLRLAGRTWLEDAISVSYTCVDGQYLCQTMVRRNLRLLF